MRVVAGTARGRPLKSPDTIKTRPIIDRVKTALFDTLGDRVVGATVLDLFGGVGSVGIEALSRGGRHATFVELDEGVTAILRENLRTTDTAERATVVRGDAFRFLTAAAAKQSAFDLIYIAPPQYHGMAAQAFQQIDAAPLSSVDGLVIIQVDPRERLDITTIIPRHYLLTDERRYGSTLLLFFTYRA